MRFADPALLWLLLLLPLLAILRGRSGRAAAVLYSTAERVRAVARPRRARPGAVLAGLRLLGVTLLVIALARPQRVEATSEVSSSGIDIVLAVDVSGSMEALDFNLGGQPANRLEVAKSVIDRFIEARPNDRIGLVAFAGRPYLVSPLTLDHEWLRQNLERTRIGLVEDGTAIGTALATSVNRLRDQDASSKIVVMLTDGVNNAGKIAPETAAEAARALGVKVYTIAAGTEGEAPMPVTDASGRRRIVQARVDVDEETLTHVAEETGGRFFRATDTDSLARIYDEIDRLEKTSVTATKYEKAEDLFAWALLPGLGLLLLEGVLANTRLRRLP
jgi:Ca-activated chloride channel family protein